ncbi:5'-nucleotidase, partial [hydrothermal vent metagenome]
MNKFFKSALLGPVMALGLAASPVMAQQVNVTFLVAADIYEMAVDNARGGFSRAAAVVRNERAKGGNLVYVWAGDAISPSLLSGFDKGSHVIDLINMEPPDIFVPGNHEFDFGKDIFNQRMGDLRSEKLAANLRNADGSLVAGFADTKMLDYDGVKIGIVGLTAEDSSTKSSPGDLVFTSSVDTLVANAAALRKQGADLVVAVTHSGWPVDQQLMNTGAVDIVLSGDDHDLRVFYDGNVAFAEPTADAYNLVAVDVAINVSTRNDRRRVKWYPKFRIIDTEGVAVPADYAAKVAALQTGLDKELNVVIGTVTTPLDTRKAMVRTQETAFGNLVTDAMKNAVGADIAITNGGGIRSNREYEANYQITRKDILSELPFGNLTLLLEVSGADIIAALENG